MRIPRVMMASVKYRCFRETRRIDDRYGLVCGGGRDDGVKGSFPAVAVRVHVRGRTEFANKNDRSSWPAKSRHRREMTGSVPGSGQIGERSEPGQHSSSTPAAGQRLVQLVKRASLSLKASRS